MQKQNLILVCQADLPDGFSVNHEKKSKETTTQQKNTCRKSAKRGLPSKNLNLFTVLHISVVVIESSVLRLKKSQAIINKMHGCGCDAARCKCKQKSKLDLNLPNRLGLDANFSAFEILHIELALDAHFFRFQNSAYWIRFTVPFFPLLKFCILN